MEPVVETGRLVVLGDRVEHRSRPAGPRVSLPPVGADLRELGEVEHPVCVGVQPVQREGLVPGGVLLELVAIIRSAVGEE